MSASDRAPASTGSEILAPVVGKPEMENVTGPLPRFHAGDLLMVQPHTTDDPVATERAGQRCRFVRYTETSFGSETAWVQFSTRGKAVPFWPKDLIVAPKNDTPEA